MKQEASAVLSRLEWYGMTFWTKLQHELLCFVCAEDEIFDHIYLFHHMYYHSMYVDVGQWCRRWFQIINSNDCPVASHFPVNLASLYGGGHRGTGHAPARRMWHWVPPLEKHKGSEKRASCSPWKHWSPKETPNCTSLKHWKRCCIVSLWYNPSKCVGKVQWLILWLGPLNMIMVSSSQGR